jgi:hypothetical protein
VGLCFSPYLREVVSGCQSASPYRYIYKHSQLFIFLIMTPTQKFLWLPLLFWVGFAGTLAAQKSVSGFTICVYARPSPECYYFCPGGRLVYEWVGMYKFGSWEERDGKVLCTFNATFEPEGFGEFYSEHLLAYSVPWAAYEHRYFKFLPGKEQISFYSYELKEKEYNWKALDADIKRNYCGKGNFNYSGDYPQASFVRLSEGDLMRLTKSQLRIMRNEIYARYGYIFKSEDMKNHFGSKAWYRPTKSNVDNLLTPLEQENVAKIQKYEK